MGPAKDDLGEGMEMLMREYKSDSESLSSALSGIEELALSLDNPSAKGSQTSMTEGSNESFPFNDSIELFLAKPANESQIVTVNTSESSANASTLEVSQSAMNSGGEAAVQMGILEEDLYEEDSDMNMSRQL